MQQGNTKIIASVYGAGLTSSCMLHHFAFIGTHQHQLRIYGGGVMFVPLCFVYFISGRRFCAQNGTKASKQASQSAGQQASTQAAGKRAQESCIFNRFSRWNEPRSQSFDGGGRVSKTLSNRHRLTIVAASNYSIFYPSPDEGTSSGNGIHCRDTVIAD